ncbi:hypothetical protein [Paraburkholderia sp. SIMBA_030]|uniref:hypothetical protein n=1 Tax=Paraburkholderia sp. SIMBA_030 TaxID=3085773 RepID=UPI00397C6494
MPILFGAARLAGLSVDGAYAMHAAVAIPAACAMAYLWLKDARFELRAALLAITTLLVQPYFIYYDFAWLALPIAFILRDADRLALTRLEMRTLAAAWAMPALGFFAERLDIPIEFGMPVLVALPAMILRRHFAKQSA